MFTAESPGDFFFLTLGGCLSHNMSNIIKGFVHQCHFLKQILYGGLLGLSLIVYHLYINKMNRMYVFLICYKEILLPTARLTFRNLFFLIVTFK